MFTHVALLDRVARTVLFPVIWLTVRVVYSLADNSRCGSYVLEKDKINRLRY